MASKKGRSLYILVLFEHSVQFLDFNSTTGFSWVVAKVFEKGFKCHASFIYIVSLYTCSGNLTLFYFPTRMTVSRKQVRGNLWASSIRNMIHSVADGLGDQLYQPLKLRLVKRVSTIHLLFFLLYLINWSLSSTKLIV